MAILKVYKTQEFKILEMRDSKSTTFRFYNLKNMRNFEYTSKNSESLNYTNLMGICKHFGFEAYRDVCFELGFQCWINIRPNKEVGYFHNENVFALYITESQYYNNMEALIKASELFYAEKSSTIKIEVEVV